jgi:hypothetical protein
LPLFAWFGALVTDARVLKYHCSLEAIPVEEELVKKLLTSAVVLMGLCASAFAQEQQSLRTLLGKGYDVKGVTFAMGQSTDNREAILVTLQKEKSIAVCYFAASTYISLQTNVIDDSKRCDVR